MSKINDNDDDDDDDVISITCSRVNFRASGNIIFSGFTLIFL